MKIKVIAVEIPFMISYLPVEPVNACVLFNESLFLYTAQGAMIELSSYQSQIDNLEHLIAEGRYEWCYFSIDKGNIISRDYDYDILVENKVVEPFKKIDDSDVGKISNTTLKLFNDFLRKTNKDNSDMVEALKISFADGFFRKEVEDIVKNDVIRDLSSLDKEIIVRSNMEGTNYIIKYVKRLLESSSYDKFIDINYFFRRIFNLEKNNWISFEE